MNVLMLATVLPSVVDDVGGATLMSWTSSAFLASSIVAATCTGYLTAIVGARNGDWRGAFFAVAGIAAVLAVVALMALPRTVSEGAAPRVPGLRVALICLAIAFMSLSAIAAQPLGKIGLLVAAIAALVVTLRVDRRAAKPLLPSDAFSLSSATGLGLWLILLVSIAYSPLQIFVPIFLQGLH